MLHRVSQQILDHNAGRDPLRVAMKFARLRQDPFGFFRGTNHLFLESLPRAHRLWRAPAVFVCGDLHLENFGTFKGDNRLCYFDINDFDEACLAPIGIDLVRFACSVHMAASTLKWPAALRTSMVRSFLQAYGEAIMDGKPRWVERVLAEGPVRALLKRATERTRNQLLDRYTARRRKRRRLRIDYHLLLEAPPRETPPIRRMLAQLVRHRAAAGLTPEFLNLLDVAHRVAGNASLGCARFALLVEGRGSPRGNFVLDLKAAEVSATAHWARLKQPNFGGEAGRVVHVQRLLQAISPALLSPVRVGRRDFVLKELQPSLDRLDLAALDAKARRLRRVASTMGAVCAWAHLRSAGHHGAASREALQRFVSVRGWSSQVDVLARGATRALLDAYRQYGEDYDAGRIVY